MCVVTEHRVSWLNGEDQIQRVREQLALDHLVVSHLCSVEMKVHRRAFALPVESK